MISYANACAQVGYNPNATRPTPQYLYYAYKDGQAVVFYERERALEYSRNVERAVVNADEIATFRATQREVERKAAELWYNELRAEYAHFSKRQFELVYAKAYEEGHSAGYDEVASTFDDLAYLCSEFKKG